jgi:hypothetical protein
LKRTRSMYPVIQYSTEYTAFNQVYYHPVPDEGQDFPDYLTRLGMLGESNLLVLSMRYHYYFDYNDLRDLKILVILKKMDMIKHLESFLNIIFRILPAGACLIGCFNNNSLIYKELNFKETTTVQNKVHDFLDLIPHHHLNRNNFSGIIESHGFKITDLTEIKGQVYFTSQKKRIRD